MRFLEIPSTKFAHFVGGTNKHVYQPKKFFFFKFGRAGSSKAWIHEVYIQDYIQPTPRSKKKAKNLS